jgi:glycosyltransferase involved in cell wall biosynthesis
VNGSGVDLDFFGVKPLPKAPSIFLLVARLLRDKGIAEYVDAARLLKGKYPTARFHLVGPLDPNPAAISRAQIDNWSREGVIDYFGSTTDVRPYIAGATVYVLPSYREGTPRSVLEAMSMGRPVVTTDVPGCRETVRHQYNGFLVPPRNSTALADAMKRFMNNPELAAAMGRNSRAIAEQKYDVRKVNAEILRHIGLSNEKAV